MKITLAGIVATMTAITMLVAFPRRATVDRATGSSASLSLSSADGSRLSRAAGSLFINGVVTDAHNRPLARAIVSAEGPIRRESLTNRRGEFKLEQLPPGIYRVSAAKAGYALSQYGQMQSFDVPSELQLNGRGIDGVHLLAWPSGSIRGQVIDDLGLPRPNAVVHTFRREYTENGKALNRVSGIGVIKTDDNGAFRISGVPDGNYFVAAEFDVPFRNESGAESSYVRTYHPNTATASEAVAVRVTAGRESFATIRLASRSVIAISGIVQLKEGRPIIGRHAIIRLLNESSATPIKLSQVTASGYFRLEAPLGPGRYLLAVSVAGSNNVRPLYGRTRINVGRQDLNKSVRVDVLAGGTISGRVLSAGEPIPNDLRIYARPIDFDGALIGSISVPVRPDGRFEIKDVFEPSRLVLSGGDVDETNITAVRVHGRDVHSLTPLPDEQISDVVVYLNDRATGINGDIKHGSGMNRAPSALLFAWTRDGAAKFVKVAKTAADGHFAFTRLSRGEYAVCAVDIVDAGYLLSSALPILLMPKCSRALVWEHRSTTVSVKEQHIQMSALR